MQQEGQRMRTQEFIHFIGLACSPGLFIKERAHALRLPLVNAHLVNVEQESGLEQGGQCTLRKCATACYAHGDTLKSQKVFRQTPSLYSRRQMVAESPQHDHSRHT